MVDDLLPVGLETWGEFFMALRAVLAELPPATELLLRPIGDARTAHGFVDRLSKGAVVEVVKAQDDWYEVQYDQKTGWIASSLTIEVSGQVSNQPKVSILKDGTNIRSEPGTNHQILVRANQGDQFAVLATEGDWFQIQLPRSSCFL
jgi:uncharacterized protein YgiM (DUF1202 family)